MQNKVLMIDDDVNIAKIVKLNLEKEGYNAFVANDGETGLAIIEAEDPDLVLLDIMMPGMDGMEVLRRIRKDKTTPVIMLTAKDDTFDKVLGLELGADDYITKPFDSKELMARIKAVIRRSAQNAPEEEDETVRYPNLEISLANYSVKYRGNKLEMPPKELELLYFLASHPGKVFTREQLLRQVWEFDFYGDSRTVDVHIKRLREKLNGEEKWEIKTVWGVGYKFEATE
ncbi:MAG: response regulator transcription factor [Clostridiales bacterium]|nr:response regulator transcription factor [Clostridiales bacterium]MBR3843048.1 response regulator transcription factor [Christensenellaceae bacterium]